MQKFKQIMIRSKSRCYSSIVFKSILIIGLSLFLVQPNHGQAVPDYVNTESYPSAVSSVSVLMPSGSQVGDVVLVYIITDDDGAIAQPVEFTELAELWQGSNGPTSGLYYRVIDGSEAGSYDFTFPSEPAVVTTLRYNNSVINSSNLVDAISSSTGNDANPIAPSITTSGTNKTILQFIAVDGASAGMLVSNIASNSVIAADQSGESQGAEMMITTSIQAIAGATPLGNYSFAFEQWTALTLAMNTYYASISSPVSGNCISASTTINVEYEVPNPSGNFELVDPAGIVVSTEAYTTSTGTSSFTFTPSLTGNYTVREQSLPSINSLVTIYIDSDGDTVCDLFDIDDDNDGVIDNIESPNCFLSLADVPFESGNRSNLISISTDWTINNGTLSNILNGDTGDNAVRKTNGDFTFSGQEFLHFTLPTAVTFDEITLHHEGDAFLDAELVGLVQGSNDGTTWMDLTTSGSVLPDAVSPHTINFTQNLGDYLHYRIFVTSGTIDDDEYLREVEFSMIFNPAQYPLGNCPDDIDGDLIANHLDLDSDGDGCSDALEASATMDVTADFQFPSGSAGANGLPDAVETPVESGIINYTSTYIPNSTFSSITGCIDRDGDTVVDANDLDLDNDGILNTVEDGYCNIDYNLGTNKSLIQISSNTGLAGSGGIEVLLNGNTADDNFWFSNSNWAGDEIVRLEFPSPTILTGLEYWIGNDHMMDYGTVTKIQGSNDGATWVDMSPNTEFTMAAPDNTSGVLSAAPYAHTFLWSNDTAYTFYRQFAISGGGNPTPFVNELFFQTVGPAICDIDGDGLPNSADLDSDGDGIPDNIEAQTTAGYAPPNSDSPATYVSNSGVNSAYLSAVPIPYTDGDVYPDFVDTESDNDRILDSVESGLSVTGVSAANGMDEGVATSNDYSDVNGTVNNPGSDLAKLTTLTTEVDYRDKQPPPQITLCYNSNGGPSFAGSNMSHLDDKLLNPANFGEFGLAYYDFILNDLGNGSDINSALLIAQGCQIFFMGGSTSTFNPAPHVFTASGLEDLKAWGESPNKVIITFQNHSTAIGGYEMENGVPVYNFDGANGNRNPNSLTTLGEEVVNGPFGQTTEFNQGGSFQGHYTLFPSYACAIATDNSSPDPRPTIMLNGETGDFYIADWGILGNTGGVTSTANITSNNDILYANLMNSAARVVIEGPTNACSFFFCPAGDMAPGLTTSAIDSPGLPVDLSTLYTGTPPAETILTWHNAAPVADENYIGNSSNYTESAIVYAAYRAVDGSCYSPSTPVNVTVNYPDLEVLVSPGTETSANGEIQSFIVTVTNTGPITAPNAQVKIPIPEDRQLVLANPSTGTYDSSSYIWQLGQMINGQSASINITIRL